MAIVEIKPYGDNGEIAGVSTSCRLRVKMEHGALKSTGAMDNDKVKFTTYIRSSMLIKLNGATKVTGVNLNGFTVYEYGTMFNFLGNSSEGDTFRSSCRYIKIEKQSATLPDAVFLSFDGFPEEVYNVQIEKGTIGGLYPSGDINANKLAAETIVFDVDGDVFTTAKLLLPPNYSINGAKVPLFIYSACDGSYRGTQANGYGWNNAIDRNDSKSDLTTELKYMADEGFAVLNIYPWGSYNNTNYPGCGWSGALAVPVTLRAYERAVEYVTTRFNVSSQYVFQASHSGSGKLSSFYAAHRPNFNLRHIYAFAPVIDGFCFYQWGASFGDMRRAMHHEMNFDVSVGNGSTFLSSNAWPIHNGGKSFIFANFGKFAQCAAVNWMNLTVQDNEEKWGDTVDFGGRWQAVRTNSPTAADWATLDTGDNGIYHRNELAISGDGVPITIFGAVDDDDCPYLVMREFVNQLNNGGGNAELITMPMENSSEYGTAHPLNSGHQAAMYYHTKSNVQTRYGGTYSTIAYGWWYAVQDINARFLKQ